MFDNLFSQNLESKDIEDFTEKRKIDIQAEEQEQLIDKKRNILKKRNEKIAKKDKNLKRIVFVNKSSGQKFMVSNKKTMDKIDGKSE